MLENISINNVLFTEKFRPKKIENLILPDRIKNLFKIGPDEKYLINQNYIFYGNPGMGKTSLAKILSNGYPTLFLNASEEGNIATIRDTINDFCSTYSVLDGKETLKIVVLDEIDGAGDAFFKALRGTIEKYASIARFIATCNYIDKLEDYVKSRFELISFDFESIEEEEKIFQKYKKRTNLILNKLNIQIDEDSLDLFIRKNFPDFRKILNKIQSWYISDIKNINLENIKKLNYNNHDLFEFLLNKNNDPLENYEFIIKNYSRDVDSVLASIGSDLPNYIKENKPDLANKLPLIIIETAYHQYQRKFVIDKTITLLSLVYKIKNIIKN